MKKARSHNLLFVQLQHPMNNWDVAAFDFEDDNFSNAYWIFLIVSEEKEITSVKGRFHAATGVEIRILAMQAR